MTGSNERQLDQETQEMLPEVTGRVCDLYMGELMGRHVYEEIDFEGRDPLWEQAAQDYPPFADTVRSLRNAIKEVEQIKQSQHPNTLSVLSIGFSKVKDIMAKELLTDVLMSRMRGEYGDFDSTVIPFKQIQAMGDELGFADGFGGEDANLKLEQVVEAVLTGKLGLKPSQTNPELAETQADTHIELGENIDLGERIGIIQVFVDDRTKELTSEFDPKSFRGMFMSAYGDASLEAVLFPLVALGCGLDKYVGVDRNDLAKVKRWANGGMSIGGGDNLTDIRVAKFGDREICFPTAQLLENFRVRRRETSRQETSSPS